MVVIDKVAALVAIPAAGTTREGNNGRGVFCFFSYALTSS